MIMGVKSYKGIGIAIVLVALLSLTQFLVLNNKLEDIRADHKTIYDSLNDRINELQNHVSTHEDTIETLSEKITELQEIVYELESEFQYSSGFTEVDDNDRLRISRTRVEFDSINRMDENTFLYKMFPRGFTSFDASFIAYFSKVDPSNDLYNRLNLFTTANEADDYIALRDSGKPQLCVRIRSNDLEEGFRVELMETCDFDTNAVRGNTSYALDTEYFFSLSRNQQAATLSIYKDSQRYELVEKLTLSLNYTGEYNVIMFPQSCGYHNGDYSTIGYLDYLNFAIMDEGGVLPFLYLPTLVYHNDFEAYEIGTIPEGWNRTSGAINDTVGVQGVTSVSGSQSLWFKEAGGDDQRIEVRTHNVSELSNIEIRYKLKISHERAVVQIANETGATVFMVNCKVDDMWGYWVEKDSWKVIPFSSIPVSGEWYDVTILVDSEQQLFRVYVDGSDSGWIKPSKGWDHISYITFRGNNNYPGEFWIDDFTLSEFT